MDVHFQRNGVDFVWNAHKAAMNFGKHGLRFERACEIFFDPLARALDAGVNEDARDALLGVTEGGALLFVVYLEKEKQSLRIISARPASPAERTEYEDYA